MLNVRVDDERSGSASAGLARSSWSSGVPSDARGTANWLAAWVRRYRSGELRLSAVGGLWRLGVGMCSRSVLVIEVRRVVVVN